MHEQQTHNLNDSSSLTSSTSNKQIKSKKRKHSWLTDLVIAIVVVSGVFWFQTRHLVGSGEPAPSFSLTRLETSLPLKGIPNESTIDNGALKGKPTVIVFWAPWCSVCGAEASSVSSLVKSIGDDVHVTTIALDYQDLNSVQNFVTKNNLEAPVLLGTQETAQSFKINTFPTIYMLDDEGKVLSNTVGFTTEWGIRARLFLRSFF